MYSEEVVWTHTFFFFSPAKHHLTLTPTLGSWPVFFCWPLCNSAGGEGPHSRYSMILLPATAKHNFISALIPSHHTITFLYHLYFLLAFSQYFELENQTCVCNRWLTSFMGWIEAYGWHDRLTVVRRHIYCCSVGLSTKPSERLDRWMNRWGSVIHGLSAWKSSKLND